MPPWLKTILQILTGIPLGCYFGCVAVSLAIAFYQWVLDLWMRAKTFVRPAPARELDPIAKVIDPTSKGESPGVATAILAGVAFAVAWPATWAIGRHGKEMSKLQFIGWASLHPSDRRIAFFDAALITCVVVFAKTGLIWSLFTTIAAVTVLVGTACRHAWYLRGDLPERLRRSIWTPLNTVARIAACDALTILFAVSMLLAQRDGIKLSFSVVREAAAELFTLGRLGAVLHESVIHIIIAAVGLLFYSVVLKTTLIPKQYRRTSDDYRQVALALVLLGDAERARSWIGKDKTPTARSFEVRAAIGLASGHFAPALREVETAQRIKGLDTSVETTLRQLWTIFEIAATPDEEKTIWFLEQCLESDVSDVLLYNIIKRSRGRKLTNAESLAKSLSPLLNESSYPLARSVILAGAGDKSTARNVLQHATPGSEIEEFVRLTAIARLDYRDPRLSIEQREVCLHAWQEQALPLAEEIAEHSSSMWAEVAGRELLSFARSLNDSPQVKDAIKAAIVRMNEQLSDDTLYRLLDLGGAQQASSIKSRLWARVTS